MSKMSQLSSELNELKRCGETLISIADTLVQLFSFKEEPLPENTFPEQTEKTPEPAAPEKTYSFTDVRALLADKSRLGHTAQVRELLHRYSAEKLSDLAPEHYAAVVAEAEAM